MYTCCLEATVSLFRITNIPATMFKQVRYTANPSMCQSWDSRSQGSVIKKALHQKSGSPGPTFDSV